MHHAAGGEDVLHQQKILHLMRVIGKGNTDLTDRMSDVLAEVAQDGSLEDRGELRAVRVRQDDHRDGEWVGSGSWR